MSGLFRAIQHLDTGVGGAREANDSLTQELEALRDMLAAANEQQLAFRQKVAMLEQALDRVRKDAARDRKFLIDHQDAFIVDLLDEQESELARRERDLAILRERLAEIERRAIETVPPKTVDARGSARMKVAQLEDEGGALDRAERAELERTAQKLAEDRERARETVHRLQAQRDEAQAAVARITVERDEALQQIYLLKAELGGPRIPLSTRPPPSDSRRPEYVSTKPPAAPAKSDAAPLTLDQADIDAHLDRPPISATPRTPSTPAMGSILTAALGSPQSPKISAPPEEVRRALTASPVLQPHGVSSRPPLKRKPDVSTRPLVGYSVNDDSVEIERLEGVRLSKPPPKR